MTPILTRPSEIWAWATPAVRTSARAIESSLIVSIPCPFVGLDAQVLVELVHAGLQAVVGNHVHDPPVLHQVMAIGDGGGEAEVLLDEQDGEAPGLEARDGGADLLADHRGQALGRLVEEEQARA